MANLFLDTLKAEGSVAVPSEFTFSFLIACDEENIAVEKNERGEYVML